MGKNVPVNAGYVDLIPGLGRSPGGENSNPLQYACLENPMDRGIWWATIYRVTKSRTCLSDMYKSKHQLKLSGDLFAHITGDASPMSAVSL